jgi:hypothetical protein
MEDELLLFVFLYFPNFSLVNIHDLYNKKVQGEFVIFELLIYRIKILNRFLSYDYVGMIGEFFPIFLKTIFWFSYNG